MHQHRRGRVAFAMFFERATRSSTGLTADTLTRVELCGAPNVFFLDTCESTVSVTRQNDDAPVRICTVPNLSLTMSYFE